MSARGADLPGQRPGGPAVARPVGPPPRSPPSLLDTLQGLWRELPGLLGDRIDILALELQRAGRALAQIVVLVVVMAILCVTAWLVLWGGIVVALVAAGMHWALALLTALLLNTLAAAWALRHLASLLKELGLPTTRRHLVPGQPGLALAGAAEAAPGHPAGTTP